MKEQQKESKSIKKYCVYKHVSPSGKVYIGITCTSLTTRCGKKGQRYKDNTYFKYAINKYGWDNFSHEILHEGLTESDAKDLEIKYIKHYKELNISYNISAGGDGCSRPVNEETRNKISKALKGRSSYIRTEEWRKRMSDIMKARPISITKEQLELAHKSSALVLSKPIIQQDKQGNLVAEFSSVREASRQTGYDFSYISKCCRGKKKEAYGYIWKFKTVS
jgi:group I intron endonuclease